MCMTNRERIRATILGEKTDRAPFFVWFNFKPWTETMERWLSEGLDKAENWNKYSGFDSGVTEIRRDLLGMCPFFEEVVLEDKTDTQVVRDQWGVVKEIGKGYSTIPKYLEFPIRNLGDWEKMKAERFDPDAPGRFPVGWADELLSGDREDLYLQIGEYPYGLFGFLREVMGIEDFLVALYEQPELIHRVMDDLTDFWIAIYERILKTVQIDHIHIWEDMSGKQGSMLSPAMMREFMVPNYQKIASFAKENGVAGFSVDTDGRVDQIIPVFLEAGMNLMMPFEVQAGSDVVKYGGEYPNLTILGGIDKELIAQGPKAIDSELARVAPLLKRGRYIPGLDHGVPPEVSWQTFLLYTERLREYIFG